MNKKNFPALSLITGIVLVGIIGYLVRVQKPASPISTSQPQYTDQTELSQTPPVFTGKIANQGVVFTNEKYKYSFQYPPDANISSEELDTNETEAVMISVWLRHGPIFTVEAQEPKKRWGIPTLSETANLELKEFTEKIWQLNKEYTNPNFPNKKIGNISPTIVAGQEAYQFPLTDAYTDGAGVYSLNGQEYLSIFVANQEGHKFILQFPINNKESREILKTFKFTE